MLNVMNRNRWTAGVIVTSVIILAIGGIAYGIHKHQQDTAFVGEPSSIIKTGASNTSSTTSPDTSSAQSTTPSCISADQAANAEGQDGCVQFTGYAYTSSSGQMYLDQSLSAPYGFSAYIPAGSSFGSSVLSQYSGQSIDVTGSIINYNGEPEIVVKSASQITLAQ